MNPRIRFKGENASEFPDWNCSQIESILTYERPDRYIVKTKIKSEGKVPVLTANKSFILGYTDEDDGIYKRGDVIIFDDFTCDCKLVNFSFKVKSSAIKLLTTDEKQYSLKFVFEAIKRLNIQPKGHQRHWISFVQKQKLFIPSLEEQQKIASFFSTLDQKIELNERKLEALEKLKKGLLQKIFKQELKFNHSNQSWANVCLIDIADVRDGTHDSPSYVPSGFPLVTSKNLLKNGEIDIESTNKISVSDYDNINKRSKVDVGDILFGMIGTIGRPVLVKESGFAIKNVALIKPKADAVNNVFLYYLFRSDIIFKQLCENKTGGNQKFVSLKIIRNLLIPLPDKDEQNHIADFLSKFDKKLAIEKQRQKLLLDLKKGLMQQMFV